jgi:hypothetical protein
MHCAYVGEKTGQTAQAYNNGYIDDIGLQRSDLEEDCGSKYALFRSEKLR